MFRYCSSFNQAIGGWAVFGGWAVDKVTAWTPCSAQPWPSTRTSWLGGRQPRHAPPCSPAPRPSTRTSAGALSLSLSKIPVRGDVVRRRESRNQVRQLRLRRRPQDNSPPSAPSSARRPSCRYIGLNWVPTSPPKYTHAHAPTATGRPAARSSHPWRPSGRGQACCADTVQ